MEVIQIIIEIIVIIVAGLIGIGFLGFLVGVLAFCVKAVYDWLCRLLGD